MAILIPPFSIFCSQINHRLKEFQGPLASFPSYLALAEAEGIPLITADEGLYNTVKKDLKWVKWTGEV